MNIGCLLITHFIAKAELARRPELAGRPVVVSSRPTDGANGAVVLDASIEAVGAAAGTPLSHALSLSPDATLIEADLVRCEREWDAVVEALLEVSPLVESSEVGCAYVELTGLDALHGGESGIARALLGAAPERFNPRVGIADSRFPAYVAATRSAANNYIIAPDDAARFLRDVPVSMLPLSWDSLKRLHGFGLKTVGQVADLSIGAVQAQFGAEGRTAWELARGVDRRPFDPVRVAETVSESVSFPSPAVSLSAALAAVETLLERLFSRPEMRGRRIRSALLEAETLNGPAWSRRIAFKSAISNCEDALNAISAALEADFSREPPGALEELRMTVSEAGGESGAQGGLFTGARKREQLRETLGQLEERLRERAPIYRVIEVEPWSRIPERRRALVEYSP